MRGALVAVDRDDRAMTARLRASRQHGLVRTNAMVVAQVWRDQHGRQVTSRGSRGLSTCAQSASGTAVTPVPCWVPRVHRSDRRNRRAPRRPRRPHPDQRHYPPRGSSWQPSRHYDPLESRGQRHKSAQVSRWHRPWTWICRPCGQAISAFAGRPHTLGSRALSRRDPPKMMPGSAPPAC